MKKQITFVLAVLTFLLAFSTPAAAAEKSYHAERFDVDVLIEEGGDLLVTEEVTYAFRGEPFTYVFREIPTDFTDGVTILETAMDGRVLPFGTDTGQVEISGSDPIEINWHMPSTVDFERTFNIRYRMEGVVRREGSIDLLRYQILPADYDFAVASSTTHIRLPAGVDMIGEPALLAGDGRIARDGNTIEISATDLAPDTPLVVSMRFPQGSLITAPPAWQARRQALGEMAPYWIGGAALLLLVGLAGLAFFWRSQSPVNIPSSPGPVYSPPGDLPPAYGGVLAAQGGRPEWSSALATLFDLARRGALQVEETGEKKWYRSHEFAITLLERPDRLDPHEEGLLNLLFDDGRTGDQVKVSELSGRASSSRWDEYADRLKAELKAAGLISKEQEKIRRRMIYLGAGLLALSGPVFAATFLLFEQWGLWPLTLMISLDLLGVVALLLGANHTTLSSEGAAVAAHWKAFAAYLKEVAKGKAAATRPDLFELYLPYAAAFGILPRWSRHFEKEGETELPPWFHAVAASGQESMAAFVALSAATSSSGGSAAGAGAAGAGAAGGGAAGAG